MTWDQRQRLMLAEMGLRVWAPLQASAAPAEAIPKAEPEPVSAPRPAPARPISVLQALPDELRVRDRSAAAPGQELDATGRLPSIARMDWLELRASAAECRACALCAGRSNSVFGSGPSHAHWLILAEAPGEQEDAAGEPFAGQAAQLLANMLRAIDLSVDASPDAGLPPERLAYLSCALKCRPPPGSTPGPAELQQCRPYLDRQIALLKPRIIFATGRLALQALLGGNEPLGRLRGRVHIYQGIPVIASFAPSYLLRNPAEKARAWDDLCLAKATLQGAIAR